jgi:hypothetical protein
MERGKIIYTAQGRCNFFQYPPGYLPGITEAAQSIGRVHFGYQTRNERWWSISNFKRDLAPTLDFRQMSPSRVEYCCQLHFFGLALDSKEFVDSCYGFDHIRIFLFFYFLNKWNFAPLLKGKIQPTQRVESPWMYLQALLWMQ